MEVQVNAKVLGKALARVKPGVSRRSNLPILFHVRITAAGDTLRLDTSNLDASVVATLACHTPREGSAIVPFKQLLDAVKAAKNADITLR
jgi:DNA polymerase III sliding clamp (beta) subunit (PCNA family)